MKGVQMYYIALDYWKYETSEMNDDRRGEGN